MNVRLALAALALLAAAPAAAHETWAIPADHAHRHAGAVVLDLTSGAAFPANETGPKRARVATLKASANGKPLTIAVGDETPGALKLELAGGAQGLAVVSVSLQPRDIDLERAELAEYFDEAGPSAAVLAAWRAQKTGPWRETYVKNAKTLVCLGAGTCAGGREGMAAVAANLEFVPLEPGPSPRAFRLLAAGKPLAGQQVEVVSQGAKPIRLRTDARGELRLTTPPRGWTLIAAVWLRPPAKPGARFGSDFASLVFDAGP